MLMLSLRQKPQADKEYISGKYTASNRGAQFYWKKDYFSLEHSAVQVLRNAKLTTKEIYTAI